MMNEFGVPMGDAEMSMLPPGANKPHEKLIADSGVNMTWTWLPYAFGLGMSLWGAHQGSKEKKAAAKARAEAQFQQFKQAMEAWEMSGDKQEADREQTIKAIINRAINEGAIRAYQDAANWDNYNYEMKIRNRNQKSLDDQYLHSEDVYTRQLSLNNISEAQAKENELRRYSEIKDEAAFDIQEKRIENLKAQGAFRAKGISGRSARKAHQITGAEMGRMIAQINEATSAAGRNTKAVLNEIAQDKISADLSADAQRMLHPGILPDPIKPKQLPLTNWLIPREIQSFDLGPMPELGITNNVNTSWDSAMPGIADQTGKLLSSLDWEAIGNWFGGGDEWSVADTGRGEW